MFARYAGMNMSPVPPGYLESAAQEASIYQNIGSTIANMMMRKQEMGLKEQEIEASKKTSEVAGKKADNEANKLNMEWAKYSTDADLKAKDAEWNRFGVAAKMLQDRESDLIPALEKETDPTKKAQIAEELNTVRSQLGTITKGVGRYIEQSMGPNSSGLGGAPNRELMNDYQTWRNIPQGIRSPIYRPSPGVVRPVPPNPSEAPAATKGAEGGVSGDELRRSGIPVATKAFTRILADVPAPVQSPGSSATVDGRPSTRVENKPDYYRSDFGYEVVLKPNIRNKNNGQIVGELQFEPGDAPGTGQFRIHADDSMISPSIVENPALREENAKRFRQLHTLKFILDNDLHLGVAPNPEEMKDANDRINADKSQTHSYSIQQAWALLTRDANGMNDEYTLRFNDAFRRRYRMNPDRYLVEGQFTSEPNVRQQSSLPGLQKEATKAAEKVIELSKKQAGDTVDSIGPDPFEAERRSIMDRLKKVDEMLSMLRPGTSGFERHEKEANRLRARHQVLTREGENHARRIAQAKAQQEARLTEIEANKAIGESITQQLALERQSNEAVKEFDINKKRWVMDPNQFQGWIPPGIARFPKTEITNSRGQAIMASPYEYLEWVSRGRNYMDFGNMTAELDLPTLENLKIAEDEQKEHGKMIAPLNRLAQEFYDLDGDAALQTFAKKWFDPNVAAGEGDVFTIMAALRKPITGGGNPSNFEQQMLLSAIPNPATVFTFNDFSIHRLRTIALLSMLNHSRIMRQNGLGELTDAAIDAYNKQYKNVLGRPITRELINKYTGIVDNGSRQWKGIQTDPFDRQNASAGQMAYEAMLGEVQRDFNNQPPKRRR